MTTYKLRQLCIKNDWFTCGTNEQYEKIFMYNASLAGIRDYPTLSELEVLSYMIWICSDDKFTQQSILDILVEETTKEAYKKVKEKKARRESL